jgi:hypothetical protein
LTSNNGAYNQGLAAKWHTGRGVPGSSIGQSGDFYLDALSADVFNRIGDKWFLATSLKGTQGQQGEQGPKGEDGAKGDTGPSGEKGDKGDQGPQGLPGLVGPKGDTGPRGVAGLPGAKGDTGAQGPRGFTGPIGPKGDVGPQGLQGDKGEKGDQGEAGVRYVSVSCATNERVIGFDEQGQIVCAPFTIEEPKKGPRLGSLNDTGGRSCWNKTDADLHVCPQDITVHGQDGDYGRDVLAKNGDLEKVGYGPAGFDLTKLDEQGNDLPEDAENWRCVRDNVTGLVWEANKDKQDPANPQYIHSYYWHDSLKGDVFTGTKPAPGSCGGIDCNTEAFVSAMNELKLCGVDNWRVPSAFEFNSVIHYGIDNSPEAVSRNITRISGFSFDAFSPWVSWRGIYWTSSQFKGENFILNNRYAISTGGVQAERMFSLILVSGEMK